MAATSSGPTGIPSPSGGPDRPPARKSLNNLMLGFWATFTFRPRPLAAKEKRKSFGKGRKSFTPVMMNCFRPVREKVLSTRGRIRSRATRISTWASLNCLCSSSSSASGSKKTAAPPAFIAPKALMIDWGMLARRRPRRSPLPKPILFKALAN